ncbi:MAG: biopolymer transporter ExbD [Candidatus Omnitrophota bacterium]|nr:biopolymer transporter ExbD [Candidatus Omnitrophota bacterium]MDD5138133.1 biopolymer transporter ExbD [Candidatus Omnitrophota bacterium]MDD5538302.1 biopolymer transporter ExbD [Candidatus Omnitrophota bacterium]
MRDFRRPGRASVPGLRFPCLVFFNVILVLFFLYAILGHVLPHRGLEISLPKVLTSAPVTGKGRVVVIREDGGIYLDATVRVSGAKDMDAFLREAAQFGGPVLIKADQRAHVRDLVRVWDAARRAGVTQISIATNE